jgi:hypothetical protein
MTPSLCFQIRARLLERRVDSLPNEGREHLLVLGLNPALASASVRLRIDRASRASLPDHALYEASAYVEQFGQLPLRPTSLIHGIEDLLSQV